jgi:hypothetical protein
MNCNALIKPNQLFVNCIMIKLSSSEKSILHSEGAAFMILLFKILGASTVQQFSVLRIYVDMPEQIKQLTNKIMHITMSPFVAVVPHRALCLSAALRALCLSERIHAFALRLRATVLESIPQERLFSSLKRITPVTRVILKTSSITSTTTLSMTLQVMFNNHERFSDSLFDDEENINDLQTIYL